MRDRKILLVLASGLLTAVIYVGVCVLLWLIFEKIDSTFLRIEDEADEGFHLRAYVLAFQMIIGVVPAWIAGAFGFGLVLRSDQQKTQPEILWRQHSLKVWPYSFAGYAAGLVLGSILSVLALEEDSHKKFSIWHHDAYSGFVLDYVDSTLALLSLSGVVIGIILASAKVFNEVKCGDAQQH